MSSYRLYSIFFTLFILGFCQLCILYPSNFLINTLNSALGYCLSTWCCFNRSRYATVWPCIYLWHVRIQIRKFWLWSQSENTHHAEGKLETDYLKIPLPCYFLHRVSSLVKPHCCLSKTSCHWKLNYQSRIFLYFYSFCFNEAISKGWCRTLYVQVFLWFYISGSLKLLSGIFLGHERTIIIMALMLKKCIQCHCQENHDLCGQHFL